MVHLLKERREKRRLFEETIEVLAGRRNAEAGFGSFKLLELMLVGLDGISGCDILLTPTRLEARFPWNPGPHRYVHEVVTGAVAQLMAWAGVEEIGKSFSGTVEGVAKVGEGPNGKGPYTFEVKRHRLEVRRDPKKVVLRIRPCEAPS